MTPEQAAKLSGEFEAQTPEALLAWTYKTFGSKVVIASSFGPEDVVLIDMAVRVNTRARIITLDTGRLPEATYAVMDAVKFKYGAVIETFFPRRPRSKRSRGPRVFIRSKSRSRTARNAAASARWSR